MTAANHIVTTCDPLKEMGGVMVKKVPAGTLTGFWLVDVLVGVLSLRFGGGLVHELGDERRHFGRLFQERKVTHAGQVDEAAMWKQ